MDFLFMLLISSGLKFKKKERRIDSKVKMHFYVPFDLMQENRQSQVEHGNKQKIITIYEISFFGSNLNAFASVIASHSKNYYI
jgi:hypothetical protein